MFTGWKFTSLGTLGGLLLCVFWMVSPALTAPFVLSDDWDILQACGEDHRADLWEMMLPFRKYQLSPEFARFFPGTWALKGLEIGLFGEAPLAYHSLRLLLGAATVSLVFLACQPWLGSGLAGWLGLAFVCGPQAITWMRLGYSEAWSMLFVAAALWQLSVAARRGYPTCPAIALLMLSGVGWIKETFIPLVPVFHALLWLSRSRWAGFWRGLGIWMVNYRLVGFDEWLVLAGCLAYRALGPSQRHQARRWMAVVAVLAASQLLISAAIFGDLVPRIQVHDGQGRYLFPGLLGPLGCMFAVLSLIRQAWWTGRPALQLALRLATGLAALSLLHRIVPQLEFQRVVASSYRDAARKFERALNQVDAWRDQHPDSPVVLLGSVLDEEGFLSLATFLHSRRPQARQPWMQLGPALGQAAWAPLRARQQKEEWLEQLARTGWSLPPGYPGIQPWPPPKSPSECLLLVLPRTAPSQEYLQGWLHVIPLPDGY